MSWFTTTMAFVYWLWMSEWLSDCWGKHYGETHSQEKRENSLQEQLVTYFVWFPSLCSSSFHLWSSCSLSISGSSQVHSHPHSRVRTPRSISLSLLLSQYKDKFSPCLVNFRMQRRKKSSRWSYRWLPSFRTLLRRWQWLANTVRKWRVFKSLLTSSRGYARV